VLADRAQGAPLGITVPEKNVEAVIAGINRLLDDREFVAECKRNAAIVAAELSWDNAVEPLVRFCREGESWAMPAHRRRLQAYSRAGMYFAMKKICQSPPLHDA
jgi:hypothetical protein